MVVTPREEFWTVRCPRWCCCGLAGAPLLVWGALRVAALLLALLCALLYYRAAKARANDAMLEELERRAAPMP
jgi:hypothetical protein